MEDSYKQPVNDRKVKFKSNITGTKEENRKWVIAITITSFFISACLSLVSSTLLEDVKIYFSVVIVLIIVLIGIAFDIIGIAVTAADESPFHAMASRKFYGARQSIKLIRNANKVSSFCNDVVGDICGIISGSASTFIIISVTQAKDNLASTITGISITGMVAALTIGGKAIGKTIGIKYSNYIVYRVGVIIMFFIGRIRLNDFKSKRK